MVNRTINDEITDIVTHEINNIAFLTDCTFTKKYGDGHADIESTVYGSISYVKVYGSFDLGDNGILLFLNNDFSNPIAIGGFDNSDIMQLMEEINELKTNKVDKVNGKTLSSNDFTNALKTKLENIENGANKITVDSTLSSNSSNPVQNKVINTALNNKVDKISGKGLSTNDFTDALKTKLDEIEAKANKIIIDTSLSSSSTNPVQNKVIYNSLNNKVDKVSGKSLSTNDFTNDLKTKLDGISAGANKTVVDSSLSSTSTNPLQNKAINTALNNKVDKVSGKGLSTNDFTTDLLNKLNAIEAQANKTVVDSALSSTSTNPLQNKAINTALNNKVDKISGKSLSTNDFTDALKTKLDGIATGATKVSVDSALSSSSTNPVQNKVINTALANKVDKISGKGLSTNDFTNDLKTKLDGIATGANKITVDSALSSTSTNPVQNKVINTALGGKANSSHTHTKSNLIHYDGGGTSGTAGYVKLLQIKVNGTYANVPISFDIYQRGSSEPSHCALMFTSGNTVDPAIGSFTYTGNQRNIYIYKETTSTWSVIVQKSENYDTIHINNVDTGHSYMDAKVTFTSLNTHVTTLPTSNITQASFIGFTSAEKTKLNGIATGANKYTHPAYTAKSSGLYKITVDATGHVSATTAVAKADITGLGIPGSDTNTTYSAGTGLNLSSTTFSVKYGTAEGTACQGNDSRLSNARTPTSHAVNANTYGLGTTGVYGHVKTINGLTQSSHSDGLALSAYQGKVLNDNITNASRIRLRFGTSNSTTSYSTTPISISLAKGSVLYISCVNYAGTAMSGAVLVEINGVLYEKALTNGVAPQNINLPAGSYSIKAYYHKNGEFLATGACKLTVT